MFAFAIWDEKKQQLFCARDRFGIKPFYYINTADKFIFASEAKALLPFLENIETDFEGLKDYFVFQFTLNGKTLFNNIKQILPAHYILIKNGEIIINKYWEVNYILDWEHTKEYFIYKLNELLEDSVHLHLQSDVEVGAYLSGGIDSSLIAILANKLKKQANFKVFNGRFDFGRDYDESEYAMEVSKNNGFSLFVLDITSKDFRKH